MSVGSGRLRYRWFDHQRDYYLKHGYDYKEATRHAQADEEYIYQLLMGKPRDDRHSH